MTPRSPIERVVVLHGYGATPDDHWFRSLAASLAPREVLLPTLPDPQTPGVEAWLAVAGDAIGTPDETTAIVGHSLGCVTALHALDRVPGAWRLGGLVLVAGFTAPRPALPIGAFTEAVPDLARTASRTGRRDVLLSDDDPFVPAPLTRDLAAGLDARVHEVPGAGHFLASDGLTDLPEATALLLG
ncbi:RBBP9/YdeN family alpha/beta hydrolase [Nocardioides bruguierae]|uniref:RBBP9/YdeN family alpha/beta hydrolase n=1 Tax=Nocardioides bruguierae TaxID=2945102 RepID=UPI00202234F0|nr:alpha/beta fold hydrolase [Nocardioides bruguierae]MCL8026358.1 alpha/beta hydrolase [Nocardioides bruguierae]